MRQPYKLSDAEVEILRLGASDPSIITDYFFRPFGMKKGWRFDENFTEKGAWQKIFHHAKQTDIVIVGGFGTGKTIGCAMSATVWCVTTPWFKFLNVADTAFQAKQMWDYIITASSGTPFEKLIWEKPRRPHHKIVIKFQVGNVIVESTMEFMSIDLNASSIFSWEGDWINIEEAAIIDNLEEVVVAVGSRLRGSVRGRTRLGRLSMISNSRHNDYFWYYFDKAADDPEHYFSMIVATKENKNVTEEQLAKMLARVPENEQKQWLDGDRPEGKGRYFSPSSIYGSEDKDYGKAIIEKYNEPDYNYEIEARADLGIVAFDTAVEKDHYYLVLGDPGTDNCPKRNSPAIMVWDVPMDFPRKPARLAGFWWGNGNGKISPFVNTLLSRKARYGAIYTGVDSTSTQKNMAEMINIQYLGLGGDAGYIAGAVDGLDFSGAKKMGYLVVLRMFLEAHLLRWPQQIVGIRAQLSNYDPEEDKKLSQDLVACMAMSAWVIRSVFNVDISNLFGAEKLGTDYIEILEEEREIFGRLATGDRYAGRTMEEIPTRPI